MDHTHAVARTYEEVERCVCTVARIRHVKLKTAGDAGMLHSPIATQRRKLWSNERGVYMGNACGHVHEQS
jgi:hypothetical protein